MLPDTDPNTGCLPPGVHSAPWDLVATRFGANGHRSRLMQGLLAALRNLAGAGCRFIFLNGSFVSGKDLPKDYDAAWEPEGVDPDLLDPVLLDFSDGRGAMKEKYFGELFPANAMAVPGIRFREFFMTTRDGTAKGIVEIDLGTLP